MFEVKVVYMNNFSSIIQRVLFSLGNNQQYFFFFNQTPSFGNILLIYVCNTQKQLNTFQIKKILADKKKIIFTETVFLIKKIISKFSIMDR